MSDRRSTSSGGSGLFLLFLVFLVLKLTHVIDWSWWWITAPLWAPTVLVLAILAVVAFVASRRPSKRAYLRDREAAQMERQQALIAETDARLRAADERRQG